MADFQGENVIQDSPRMRPALVDQLVVYLLADVRVAQAANELLKPSHFTAEPQYRVLWEQYQALSRIYGMDKVTYDALMLALVEGFDAEPVPVPPMLQAKVSAVPSNVGVEIVPGDPATIVPCEGVVYHAYKMFDPKETSTEHGVNLLRRFLHERAVVDEAVRVVVKKAEKNAGDFASVVNEITQLAPRIKTLGEKRSYGLDVFPDEPEPIEIFTTRVGFLDHFLDGGVAGGEVHIVTGPQKAGKSFLAGEVVCGAAENFSAIAAAGGPRKVAVLITYELSYLREFRPRLLSRGADVSLTRLSKEINPRKGVHYSTSGALLAYELDYYKARKMFDFDSLPGEKERIHTFNQGPGRHIRVLDMTGKDGYLNRGYGGAKEIVEALNEIRRDGFEIGLVAVDYINKAINRQLDSEGKDADKFKRPAILRFINEMIDKVAVPNDCPVLLLQQYGADGQDAKPTKRLRATNAGEARTIGENAHSFVCMGTVDPKTKVLRVDLDLCRRTDKAGQMRLIKLDYEFARFRDVTDLYDVDEVNGVFTPKDVAAGAKYVDPVSFVPPSSHKGSPDPYKLEPKKAPKASDSPY